MRTMFSLFLLFVGGVLFAGEVDSSLAKVASIDDKSLNVPIIDNFDALLISIKLNKTLNRIDNSLLAQYAFIKHPDAVAKIKDKFDFNKYAQGLKPELLAYIDAFDTTKVYKFRVDVSEITNFDFDKNGFWLKVRGNGGIGAYPKVEDTSRFGNINARFGNILARPVVINAKNRSDFLLLVGEKSVKSFDEIVTNNSGTTELVVCYALATIEPTDSASYRKYLEMNNINALNKQSRSDKIFDDGVVSVKVSKVALVYPKTGKVIGYATQQ